jgi:hypothetical protein
MIQMIICITVMCSDPAALYLNQYDAFSSISDIILSMWYGMVKLYLNKLASINVSCFSWGASYNNYLQIKKYTH